MNAAETPVSQLRFLVAEDHEFQRLALVSLLSRMGVGVVHEASDGNEALAVLRDPARPVDIIISDLEMPGMDGMEFVRHLGETGTRVSIVLASGLEPRLLASIATMSQAYGINLLGAVEKPLTAEKLRALIGLHHSVRAKKANPADPVFTQDEIAAGLKNEEFEPFFQPKIELATGKIRGVEALARWRHPQHGIVAPIAFITILEENGQIEALTRVMLARSAEQCRSWRNAGLDASVSVNVSVKSLGDVHFAESMTELVRRHHLDPRHMIIEVTETTAATDVGRALENLARLRMNGFGLSIDDYGTGYSSMQQLGRIAFTELKIDQSFVMNAVKQESSRVFLKSSLGLAKRLKLTSVAEGVQTRPDVDLLLRLHCDLAQGYFIARPMSSAAFHDWQGKWGKAPWSAIA